VYTTENDSSSRFWLVHTDIGAASPLAGTQGAMLPAFSPDGHELAFAVDSQIRRLALADGAVSRVTARNWIYGLWWLSPDRIFLGGTQMCLRATSPYGAQHVPGPRENCAWTGRLASDRDAITGSIMLWTGPGVDTDELCERFAQAVQTALVGQEEIEIQIDVVQDRVAFSGSEGSESFLDMVETALKEAGIPREIGGGTFTTDAGLFRAHGFDTVVFGPGGPLEALYRDDESISVKRLEATAAF